MSSHASQKKHLDKLENSIIKLAVNYTQFKEYQHETDRMIGDVLVKMEQKLRFQSRVLDVLLAGTSGLLLYLIFL